MPYSSKRRDKRQWAEVDMADMAAIVPQRQNESQSPTYCMFGMVGQSQGDHIHSLPVTGE